MAKGKGKKIIATLLTLVMLAGASIFVYDRVKDSGFGFPGFSTTDTSTDTGGSVDKASALTAPSNVKFDETTNEITWQGVKNAKGYLLWVNGNTYEIGANDLSEKIVLKEGINEFKVKAIGDGEDFTDSNWSQTVTYNMTQQAEQSLYNKVNMKLAEAAKQYNYEFVSVIGISYANSSVGNLNQNFTFETLCKVNDKFCNVQYNFNCSSYTSLQEMIENFDDAIYLNHKYQETVSYNSAESLIKSGSYDGKMQELKNNGYQITVLDSVVREGSFYGDVLEFEIVGTYKATKAGADDVYFSSINTVDVLNPSRNESSNYTTFLEYEQYRNVTETKYVLHEKGTTLDYILDWEQKSVENVDIKSDLYYFDKTFAQIRNNNDGVEVVS